MTSLCYRCAKPLEMATIGKPPQHTFTLNIRDASNGYSSSAQICASCKVDVEKFLEGEEIRK